MVTPKQLLNGRVCPDCSGPIVRTEARQDWHCNDHPDHDISAVMPPICDECGNFMTPDTTVVQTDAGPMKRPTGFLKCPKGHSRMA